MKVVSSLLIDTQNKQKMNKYLLLASGKVMLLQLIYCHSFIELIYRDKQKCIEHECISIYRRPRRAEK